MHHHNRHTSTSIDGSRELMVNRDNDNISRKEKNLWNDLCFSKGPPVMNAMINTSAGEPLAIHGSMTSWYQPSLGPQAYNHLCSSISLNLNDIMLTAVRQSSKHSPWCLPRCDPLSEKGGSKQRRYTATCGRQDNHTRCAKRRWESKIEVRVHVGRHNREALASKILDNSDVL